MKSSLEKRGLNTSIVEEITSLDELWRKHTQRLELLQSNSNQLSKTKDLAQDNKEKLAELKSQINQAKEGAKSSEAKLIERLMFLPNIVLGDVPAGDQKNNKVLSSNGKPGGTGPTHEDVLEKNNLADLRVAAEFSGSRYRYLIGDAAKASRKLFDLAINFAEQNGFKFVLPPVVARQELMEAAGFFPAGKDDTFALGEGQFLVGTSEPLLLALAANRKFSSNDLPLRYVGFSTCFRKEAGSYGKDVKGMFRVHQFDKVEMVSIVKPEESEKEHQFLVDLQKKFVDKFDLPYQEVLLAAGDQSQIAAKQIDIECWFPSQQRYRETHSASNCSDYQAKLLKTKVETAEGLVLAHTLNATLATERLLLAIIENNTNEQLEINWPKELKS